jgi:signal peptidase I
MTSGPWSEGRPLLRWWAGVFSAGWLILVVVLSGWALLPALVGWRPQVVASGSMAPALNEGDVALVDPKARSPRLGQIVEVRDPDVAGGLLTHRVAAVSGGVLTTKGDANAEVDRRPVAPGDLVGTVRLVVPVAGWPILALRHPSLPGIVCLALTVAALAGLGCLPRDETAASFVSGRGGGLGAALSAAGLPEGVDRDGT